MSGAAFGSFGNGGTPVASLTIQAKFSGVVLQGEAGATVAYLADDGIGEAIVPGANQVDASRYPTSARDMKVLRVCAPLGNTSGQDVVVTLFKNDSATTQTITIPNGAAAGDKFVDSAHAITFADGDDFDLRCDVAAAMAANVAVTAVLEG